MEFIACVPAPWQHVLQLMCPICDAKVAKHVQASCFPLNTWNIED